MLTPKQEKFVQGLVMGMSQREAYKNSYDTENATDETTDSNASRLFADSKILARYNELIEKADDKAIMTAIQRKKWLSNLILIDECNKNDKLKALDILNKMDSQYTEKIQYEDVTPKWFKKNENK